MAVLSCRKSRASRKATRHGVVGRTKRGSKSLNHYTQPLHFTLHSFAVFPSKTTRWPSTVIFALDAAPISLNTSPVGTLGSFTYQVFFRKGPPRFLPKIEMGVTVAMKLVKPDISVSPGSFKASSWASFCHGAGRGRIVIASACPIHRGRMSLTRPTSLTVKRV